MSSSSRVVGATGRENRRDKRRSFDISAVLNNQPVIISDFSLGGVSIAGFEIPQKDRPTLRVGDHALLTLFQADGEVAETFDVESSAPSGRTAISASNSTTSTTPSTGWSRPW